LVIGNDGGGVRVGSNVAEPGVHGHAAHVRIESVEGSDAALVGGAFVNVDAVHVRIKKAEFDPCLADIDAGCVFRAEIAHHVLAAGAPLGQPAAGEGGGIVEGGGLVRFVAVGDKVAVVVVRKHFPGSAELLQVVNALYALGFLFGLGQRGQDHCGEDGDDGDDHEQLD